MEKVYDIKQLKFEGDSILLNVDKLMVKLNLEDVSKKLLYASDQERNDFTISPSGYGVHWRLLDEDLSINGILQLYYSNQVTTISSQG